MKTLNKPFSLLAIVAVALMLSACGKTKRTSPATSSATVVTPTDGSNVPPPPQQLPCQNCNPSTPSGGTQPPYSFEINRLMGTTAASTGQITTDNVLKVKFRVTADQGNNFHQASELKVTLAMGGTEVTPTYTSGNYTFGQVGETSNVIDLSNYITPGQPVTIVIKNPRNDFYCTYFGYGYWDGGQFRSENPLYQKYPGCRKDVNANHYWSGVLLVQTSATTAI